MAESYPTPENPEVSVILPVYNAGSGLTACLRRLDDTHLPRNAEIIIVDDGSIDETPERVRAYAAGRRHVRPIFQSANSGVADARNTALRAARGEYIWFVDWDDEWELGIVERMLDRAMTTGADVVVCQATWQLPTGQRFGVVDGLGVAVLMTGSEAFDAVLAGRFKGYLWSKLLRRAMLPADPFPRMTSQSDFCGIVPVIATARLVASEPSVQYRHVIREGSLTNSRSFHLDNVTTCRDVVRTVAANRPRSRHRDLLLLRYDYAHWHLGRAKVALRLNEKHIAQKELSQAASAMRLSEIASLARVDVRVAVESVLVKATGPGYPALRQLVVSVRAQVRRLRCRG